MKNVDDYLERKSLALSLYQNGELEKATKELHSLHSQHPDDPQCLHPLGEGLLRLGDLNNAEHCFRRLVFLYPNIDVGHYSLGICLGKAGKPREAFQFLSKAFELNPKNLDACLKAGLVSLLEGLHPRAISYFEKALEIDPENPEAHSRLGGAFVELGDLKRARSHFERVLSKNPLELNALGGLANIYLRELQIDKAYELISPAIEHQKTNPGLALVYSEICEKRNDLEQAINILSPLPETPGLTTPDKAIIKFRLGKLYDKAGIYDQAFATYAEANSLSNINYNAALTEKELNTQLHFWKDTFFASAPRIKPINSVCPIFIVGMPRSGTSLAEQILASHSNIHGAGELQLIKESIFFLFEGNKEQKYPNLIESVSQEKLEAAAKNHIQKLEKIKNTEKTDALYVTDKMPDNFWHLGLIQLLFPNAKIIHCTRNPLDTCLSCYFQNFAGSHPYSYNLKDLGVYYSYYRKLMMHWETHLELEIFELNYENLIENFEETCRALISFCELPWSDNCLTFYESGRTVTTSSYDQARNPIHKGSMARWQNYDQHLGLLRQSLDI